MSDCGGSGDDVTVCCCVNTERGQGWTSQMIEVCAQLLRGCLLAGVSTKPAAMLGGVEVRLTIEDRWGWGLVVPVYLW